MTSFDLGPCTWSGPTSGSVISTSRPELFATPFAQRRMSLSASESQKRFSSSRSSAGSLRIPPSAEVTNTYLHWPTSHFVRSRGTSMFVNVNASGPEISTWRSTPTSRA